MCSSPVGLPSSLQGGKKQKQGGLGIAHGQKTSVKTALSSLWAQGAQGGMATRRLKRDAANVAASTLSRDKTRNHELMRPVGPREKKNNHDAPVASAVARPQERSQGEWTMLC